MQETQETWVWCWVRKVPWRRKWQHTPVFLPGKFHGQRSVAGYSPWGRKESDTTERTHNWEFIEHLISAPLPAMLLLLSHFSRVLTLCDPMDCRLPGSSVHGVLQARVLEWAAMPSSRGSSQPRDQTRVSSLSCIGKVVLYHQYHLGNPVSHYTEREKRGEGQYI